MNFEYARKSIHLLSLFVPLCAYYSLFATQLVLIFFILLYLFSEFRKIKGQNFFLHRFIKKIQRPEEQVHFAPAPFYLALGVLFVITIFSWKAAAVGIYCAGFCDTIAAFCGKKWGVTRMPFVTRKSYAGTICFFVSSLPATLWVLSPSKAIVVSLVGAFLESLPFRDLDNLLVPLAVSFLVEQFMFA